MNATAEMQWRSPLRVVYHLLSTKESLNESFFYRCEIETLRRAEFLLANKPHDWDFSSSQYRPTNVA
jgi:hypothetical protein